MGEDVGPGDHACWSLGLPNLGCDGLIEELVDRFDTIPFRDPDDIAGWIDSQDPGSIGFESPEQDPDIAPDIHDKILGTQAKALNDGGRELVPVGLSTAGDGGFVGVILSIEDFRGHHLSELHEAATTTQVHGERVMSLGLDRLFPSEETIGGGCETEIEELLEIVTETGAAGFHDELG